jgi:pimeloyl-ACP methyl ester carboxylesterase
MIELTEAQWDHRAVDVGGRCLQVALAGDGDPTVVVDHGEGSTLGSWGRVLAEVAALTRVFVYARAGFGDSDPAPRPRTVQDLVDDLHAALVGSGAAAPYVLVGHSLAGMTMRLYASRYPREVAGVVSVDGANELQYERTLALAPPDERERLLRRGRGGNREGIDIWASVAQMRAAPPPPISLVVLTAGRPQIPRPGSAIDSVQLDRMKREVQEELASRVPGSRHVIAQQSGHAIHQDEPDLVVDAIRTVVDEVRRA